MLEPGLHGRTTADAIAGAEFELIEGGHMLPVTHPAECARVLRGVLARVGR